LRRILTFCALLFTAALVFSQTDGIELSIRYFDKEVYQPESDVFIKLMITNNTADVYRFRLADNRIFNLNFDARTLTNQQLESSEKFTTERTSNQQVFFREVSLAPGEEYAFVENLADYVKIPGAGMYVVSARFYPELVTHNSGMTLSSNRLTLSVEPSASGLQQMQARIDQETGQILKREDMPPDEVVAYTIHARQHGEWNKFFLYLDVESILRSNPERERRFLRLSEEEQRAEVVRFRDELMGQTVDEEINVIPERFQMIQTTYTPGQGRVVVDEYFDNGNFTLVKRYTYMVRRRDGVWEIYDYTVTNRGTE